MSTTHLSTVSGQAVAISRVLEYRTNQFWVVVPERALTAGLYVLHLKFSGSMTLDIVGLYMSAYTDSAGRQR